MTKVTAASCVVMVLLLCLVLLSSALVAGEETAIQGRVRDEATMEPIPGANITLSNLSTGEVLATTVSDLDGRYIITGPYYGWLNLTIEAEGYNASSREFEIEGTFEPTDVTIDVTLSVVTGPGPGPGPSPVAPPERPYLQYAAVLIIVIVASSVMYSKIKRDNLLKHAVRRRIYEYVKENPGQHYRAILNDLGLTMGVLTYHLNRLEKAEYLRSRQDGMYRRFFVAGRKTEVRFFLSDIQETILATIRSNQGISQSKIAEGIGVTRKVVNYHVRILDQAGLIYVEDRGRETACFAPECKASAAL